MDWSRILEDQRRRLALSGGDARRTMPPLHFEQSSVQQSSSLSLRVGPQAELSPIPAHLLGGDMLDMTALRAPATRTFQPPALDYMSLALPQTRDVDYYQLRQQLLLEEEARLRQEVMTRALQNSAFQSSQAEMLGMLSISRQTSHGSSSGPDAATAVRDFRAYEQLLAGKEDLGKLPAHRGSFDAANSVQVAAVTSLRSPTATAPLQRILPVSRPSDRSLTFPLPARTGTGQTWQTSPFTCFQRLWAALTEGPSNLSADEMNLFAREFFARRIGKSDEQGRLHRRFHGLEESFDSELRGRTKRRASDIKMPPKPIKRPR